MPRPRVTLNAAITLDGKIAAADRRKFDLSSNDDRLRMGALRDESGAVIVGAGTIRAEDPPPFVRGQSRSPAPGQRPFTWIVLTRTLNLPPTSRMMSSDEVHVIVAAPRSASNPAAELELGRRAEIWRVGQVQVDPTELLTRLGQRGYQRVVVEGGGEINYLFLRAGVVDELRLTLCPYVLGGATAPTLVDGPGFAAATPPGFHLAGMERLGEELFLRYKSVRG